MFTLSSNFLFHEEEFAGVHKILRIQEMLDVPHECKALSMFLQEKGALSYTHAVFSRAGSFEFKGLQHYAPVCFLDPGPTVPVGGIIHYHYVHVPIPGVT